MAIQVIETIKKLLPKDPVNYVTVLSVVDGVSTVQGVDGLTYTAFGDSVAVGQKAWEQGGSLLSTAPASMATSYIII